MKILKNPNLTGVFIMFCILLTVWYTLSCIYTPLVLPSPALTFKSFVKIIQSGKLFMELAITLQRLVTGLALSVLIGSICGILIGYSKTLRYLAEPFTYFIQSVPPILYMTLAMLWFGLNGTATVFIVLMGSAPVMAVNIAEGFENIDVKLVEMGKAFKFSRYKMIANIILPSLKAYFKTGLITVFSFGWKLVIMGEVLSSSTGLGAQITDARVNLETNMVFAWGIVVILLCFIFQKTASKLFQIDLKPRKFYE